MRLSDWQSFFQCLLWQRWFRFGIVGFAATAAYYLLGLLCVYWLSCPILVGNAIAYILSFAISYTGQALWTFQARSSHKKMLPKFAIAQAIGLGINSLIIKVSTNCGLAYSLAMLVAIVIVPVFVYFICKFWVFAHKGEANC